MTDKDIIEAPEEGIKTGEWIIFDPGTMTTEEIPS